MQPEINNRQYESRHREQLRRHKRNIKYNNSFYDCVDEYDYKIDEYNNIIKADYIDMKKEFTRGFDE